MASRAHTGYLRRDLPGPVPHALLQPTNKGTAPAILWPAYRVRRLEPDAVVAVFPSDHYVNPNRAFMADVARAVRVVRERPDLVVRLGVDPDGPDEEYGWIDPGEPVLGAGGCVRVRGFWEKPTAGRAHAFLGAGFLWNSLVVVARAGTLTALGRRQVPDVAACLEALETHVEGQNASSAVSGASARLGPPNFSRQVLEREADALVVPTYPGSSLERLGDPRPRGAHPPPDRHVAGLAWDVVGAARGAPC